MTNNEQLNILYITGGENKYHNFDEIGPFFKQLITGAGHRITVTEDLDMLLTENIKNFDVIICYSINSFITEEQEKGLLDAVIGSPWSPAGKPKGFIGIHGATFTFRNSPRYLNMVGGRFLTHPEIGDTLTFHVEKPEHPVMAGVKDFQLDAELYLMEELSPFEPLLTCDYRGFKRPVAWVKPYGRGRIFYLSLGHDVSKMDNDSFKQMVLNAVKWSVAED